MKYNPKEENLVFIALKERSLATPEEVDQWLEAHHIEVPANTSLILERWKARDALVIQYCDDGKKRYKLAKIPSPFVSAKIENVKTMRSKEMVEAMKIVEAEFPENAEAITPVKGRIGNYHLFEVVIETIDPILGGTPQDGENIFRLHRNPAGKPVIAPAQWKGWFRENSRLFEWNPNARSWITYSEGVPVGEPKLIQVKAPIVVQGRGAGVATYEAFPSGTRLKATFGFPFRGIGVTSVGDIEALFKRCEISPKRGLGANPFYCGGKIKLVEIKEIQ